MNSTESILKEYVPASWFHPIGVHKVLKRIWHRLPDVSGKLFITLTLDPKLFADAGSGFDYARDRLRRVFHKLRQGVECEGKRYVIDAPYCVKVEFHKSGWVHFHVIFLTRRFIPADLLTKVWGMGRVNIKRIANEDFHYLLKYVCKPADMPDWVKRRKRLRVFQSARGFLKREPEANPSVPDQQTHEDSELTTDESGRELGVDLSALPTSKRRASYTIGERIERWARMATLVCGEVVRTITFRCAFRDIFDRLVLSIALDGRYLGNGATTIRNEKHMLSWIKTQNQLMTV